MYISLGASCAVSNYLKRSDNHNTLPFDWARINIKQLILVLTNDFKSYNNIKIHKYSENHKSYILKNNYNIQFAHEVLNKYNLDEFKNKLNQRILKFNEILNNRNDEIKFIRFEFSPYRDGYFNEFYKLLNIINNKKKNNCKIYIKLILHKSYKDKDYFNNTKNKLNKVHIETQFFDEFSNDWKYPNINWCDLLK